MAEAEQLQPPTDRDQQAARRLDARDELVRTRQDLERVSTSLREANAEVQRLREQLKLRDEQIRIFETRQAYHFARTLIEVRNNPLHAWKLPIAFVKLVLPNRTLRFARDVRSRVRERRLGVPRLPSTVVNEPWPADRPLVSVVVVCFNYGRFLDDALRSLGRQTLHDFEIILIEGGSTDGVTPDRVRAVRHPRMRKIFQPRPTRVGDNRLAGIASARGKYIVCLDADDMLEPTYLEKATMALELTGVDIAYPSVRSFDRENGVWETTGEFTLQALEQIDTIATVAAFRAETWRRLRIGYGTHVKHAIEDWDFWLRFAERGARGYKIREPLMLYRVHGDSLTTAARNQQNETFQEVLEEHRPYLDPRRVTYLSEKQRELPTVKDPLVNLARLERRSEAGLRIALALPWLAVGGSDHLLLQVFGQNERHDASLCVYTTLGALPSMGSSTSEYCKITDDVFELQRELPEAAQADAILHLLRSRRSNVLMIVGSAATYGILPRIRAELPGLRIVDHLYNTVGHLASNRRFAAQIDFHIVANEEVRQALLAAGEPDHRIRVIPHGIDMEHYSPARVPWQGQGFDRLPLAAGKKLVLYAGRFSEEKGVLRFIDLVERMRSREEIVFAMLGDGPQRPEVEKKIDDLGLRQRVRLLGFVDDSRAYLRRADAMVIPSDVEGLPLVCLEALALGTPVVASAIGSLPSVIRPGVTGALADPSELGSFVRGLQVALGLDTDRERLAASCRESVLESYAIEKVREAYFEVFRKVAGLGAPSTAAGMTA